MTGGIRRILSLVGGNVLSFALILASAAVVGEVWLRLRWPFPHNESRLGFVPRVGRMFEPDTEVRWTNRRDFWTVSRTNRWGFLDREPIGPERAAASCHVALIGDSFVAAREVPIADKVHVRLEALAARVLPDLDVTTSAFGIPNTGQINQLPLYGEFARRLRPRLLVLVFVINDFANNTSMPRAGPEIGPYFLPRDDGPREPDRLPWTTARRNADGGMRLLPPPPPRPGAGRSALSIFEYSWFANWLTSGFTEIAAVFRQLDETEKLRPAFPPQRPELIEEALEFTAFGFDLFKERADRDGVALAILSTHTMETRGHPPFDSLNALAAARRIPVIDQFDHIRRRGAEPRDARWAHDSHWNPAGHQWAAEALLEYLKRNPEVCVRPWTGGR